ncbi:MAG TPA: tetratricopeptide repeat protein, partial [Thermoanaerobaculia bacterium]
MSRRIAAVAALLLQLLAASLDAQQPEPAQKSEQLRKALQEHREKKDLHREALTLLRLGAVEADLGRIDGARSALTDAAKKMRAQNDAIGTWLAHFLLAHVENAVGRPKEAIAQLEAALAVIDHAYRSTAPVSVEALLASSGLPPETIDALASNPELKKPRILQEHLEPLTHDLYGSVLTKTGQLEKAEEELNEAAVGSRRGGGSYDFSIAAHLGDLRFRQQRYDEARAHYRKALSGLAKGAAVLLLDRKTVEAGIYDRLAHLEIITGHPEEARRWNDKALEIARSPGGPRSMQRERLPVTDAELREALKVAAAMKNVARQAAIESRLGNLQMTNGNDGSAASHFERSVQLYQSLHDLTAETTAWGDLCLLYIRTRNYAAAENALTRARKRVGNRSEYGDDMLAWLETTMRFQRGKASAADFRASVERYIRHTPAEDAG